MIGCECCRKSKLSLGSFTQCLPLEVEVSSYKPEFIDPHTYTVDSTETLATYTDSLSQVEASEIDRQVQEVVSEYKSKFWVYTLGAVFLISKLS